MKFEGRREGVVEILRSPEVQAEIQRRADKVRASVNQPVEASTYEGKNRIRGSVITSVKAGGDTAWLARALDQAT